MSRGPKMMLERVWAQGVCGGKGVAIGEEGAGRGTRMRKCARAASLALADAVADEDRGAVVPLAPEHTVRVLAKKPASLRAAPTQPG